MAVGQARKTYKNPKDAFGRSKTKRDDKLITALTKELDKTKGNYNKWKQNPKVTKERLAQSNRKIDSLQASINKARGVKKQDFKKNPLKISDKGLTPPRKLSKKEGKIGTSKTIGGKGPGGLGTAKQKEEARKKMLRRSLSKSLRQRKHGGQIKKYSGKKGSMVKKCPRDGIAIKGKTRA